MTNVFQCSYEDRLGSWYMLRQSLVYEDLKTRCINIDEWWQWAPEVSRYLHTHDVYSWPDPWELLVDNTYCPVARALGMCYTLKILGEESIEMVHATNKQGVELILVLVDSGKYIMNYWPNTVESNKITDFDITRTINISPALSRIK